LAHDGDDHYYGQSQAEAAQISENSGASSASQKIFRKVSVDVAHPGTAFMRTMKLDPGIGSQPVWPIQNETARRSEVYALTGHQHGTLYNGTDAGWDIQNRRTFAVWLKAAGAAAPRPSDPQR